MIAAALRLLGRALNRAGHCLTDWGWRMEAFGSRGRTFRYKVTFVSDVGVAAGESLSAHTLVAFDKDGRLVRVPSDSATSGGAK